MLHGYTQSGPLFHAKTRALEKHIQKAIPGSSLSYPTGPVSLDPSNIPGLDPSSVSDPGDIEACGWWRRSNTADPPEYLGLQEALAETTKVLASEGPFDGVIGFSQGAALAGMVASLLEGPPRRDAFAHFHRPDGSVSIAYPSSFASLQHGPLKFFVVYSGFVAPGERYKAFYERPLIQTPSCHFVGGLDSVVEESRCRALIDASGGDAKAKVVFHPGGHFVPNSKQYLDTLVDFIKAMTSPRVEEADKLEESVMNMDVPF